MPGCIKIETTNVSIGNLKSNLTDNHWSLYENIKVMFTKFKNYYFIFKYVFQKLDMYWTVVKIIKK